MIRKYPKEKSLELRPLFKELRYLRLLLFGLLQRQIGHYYVDNITNPTIALVGHQVVFFLAGKPNSFNAEKILEQIPPNRLILLSNNFWLEFLTKKWGKKLHKYTRTKFSSKKLDINKMQEIVNKLPGKYSLVKLGKKTINQISEQAKSIISLFYKTTDEFLENNFGFCIIDNDRIASVALAATPIDNDAFEIHIETDPDYQRQGLATITAAKLIVYSLKKGMIPHWDADNKPSAKLAIKLGFTEPEEYITYFWTQE